MRLTKVTVGETTEPVVGQRVTGDYHATLGVRALIGRAIEPADSNERDRQPVAVLGYEYWRQRFGADPRVLGRTLLVEGEPYTIVGVTRAGVLRPPGRTTGRRDDPDGRARGDEAQGMVFDAADRPPRARRHRGARAGGARGALRAVRRGFRDDGASAADGLRIARATPAGNGLGELRDQYSRALLLLAGVVGLVLLLACANVSAVQLARAQSRTRELTIRRVLGAGRGRLMRQLMTESALLAILGGAAGLLVAWWAANLLASYLPGRGLPSA